MAVIDYTGSRSIPASESQCWVKGGKLYFDLVAEGVGRALPGGRGALLSGGKGAGWTMWVCSREWANSRDSYNVKNEVDKTSAVLKNTLTS